ncbi:MAG: phosphonate ABC transporter permease, partial [bacterium]
MAILLLGFLALCIRLAQVDPEALINGLPRLFNWAAKAWPPLLIDLDAFALRGLETVAIATVGTVVATLLA